MAVSTFTAFLFALLVADLVFNQCRRATDTDARNPGWLFLHMALIWVCAAITFGRWDAGILAGVAITLPLISLATSAAPPDRLWPFLVGQAARLGAIAAVAIWWPDVWDGGAWSAQTWLLPLMAIAAGAVITTHLGGAAIGLLMAPWIESARPGLPNGGKLIGVLERGLIFLLVMVGHPVGIGFLIAAKSILRFDSGSDQKFAEYVIIGTLASFGWAILWSFATLALLSHLDPLPLEIVTSSP